MAVPILGGLIKGLKELIMHLKDFGTGCPAHNKLIINHGCKDFFPFLLGSWRDQEERKEIQPRRLSSGTNHIREGETRREGCHGNRGGENTRKEGDLTQKGTQRGRILLTRQKSNFHLLATDENKGRKEEN